MRGKVVSDFYRVTLKYELDRGGYTLGRSEDFAGWAEAKLKFDQLSERYDVGALVEMKHYVLMEVDPEWEAQRDAEAAGEFPILDKE